MDGTRICLSWQWPPGPHANGICAPVCHVATRQSQDVAVRSSYLLKGPAGHLSPRGRAFWAGRREQRGLAARFISCLDKSWVLSHARPSLASGQVGSQWVNIRPIP